MKRFIMPLVALALVPAAHAAEISVGYSPEFQEALEDNYGVREGDRLADDIREDLERELRKANIDPARIDVTILDAKPNRPTMQQATDQPGLDTIRSKSIGGMDLKGVAYDVQGNAIAELEYDWFETNIQDVVASSTWGDAKRSSHRFARKFTAQLSGQ